MPKVFSVELANLGDGELFIVRTPNPRELSYVTQNWSDVLEYMRSHG